MSGISDAISRETAWLASSGDGLPALLAPAGPFAIVQARWSRTPSTRQTGLYLMPGTVTDDRWANQRKLTTYAFRLVVVWPIGTTTVSAGIAELEQQALDDALELVIGRIRGTLGDHSHGGRFLAVAEAPAHSGIAVQYSPPESTVTDGVLRAEVHYQAQDQVFI